MVILEITALWEIGADLKKVQIWKNNKQSLGPNVGPALFGPLAGPQLKLALLVGSFIIYSN